MENQDEFIQWIAQKLQAKDEKDLKEKLGKLGKDGIKQAYELYNQEVAKAASGEPQELPEMAEGGKLEYLKCLQAFKKGGSIGVSKCGCGGTMYKTKMKKEDGGKLEKKVTSYIK